MRFLNAILIKLCLGFSIGVYIGFFDVLELKLLAFLSILLLFLLVVFKWVWRLKSAFLFICILLFMVLGCVATCLHLPKHQPQHLFNLDYTNSHELSIQAEVNEILRSNAYNHKVVLDNLRIQGKAYRGKILWQISKDIKVSELYVGQNVMIYTSLKAFQDAKNPQVFDYASFMKNRNVYAIVYEDHFETQANESFSFNAFGAKQRRRIVTALEKAGFEEKQLELMQALILGQKQAIDKDTYNDFAEVGVVHILAVSGLHVGIVLVLLQFLLKPLLRLPKYGRPLMVILSILGLWSFATLAGYSPSVLRASTMFTFLAFGQLYRRKTNSINMLCLSALFLLLINPQFIFEVGFQLSYAAVFSIVMLYPVFSKLYQPKYKLPKIFVDTAYVSLAAQIGVLPFQLYYFHQFPGLFLLGNIVVIPFLGVLLSGGIICIILSLLGLLISPLVKLYSTFLDALILFVDWLSTFKAFVIKDIFFTKPMFLGILVVVFLFVVMMREFKAKQISGFLVASLTFTLIVIYEIAAIEQKSEVVIFHRPRATVLGVKQGYKLQIYSDSATVSTDEYWLKNYNLLNRIKSIEIKPLANTYKIGDKRLIRIDSSGFYTSEIKSDVILLSESPDIHLGKLIKQLNPKQIIVDGNNYRSYVERWQKTAEELDISFHNTYSDGFVRFNLP